MRRGSERLIGDAVMRLADSLAPQTPLSRIERAWPKVVGEALAKHSKPARLSGSQLTVNCSGSVYAQELDLQSAAFVAALADELGGGLVERIRFVVDTGRKES